MKQLTEKQRAFVENKAAGVPNREAAIAAGYSSSAADVTAAKLMRRADIKAAIKAAAVAAPSASGTVMPREHYADPVSFLEDVMNHPQFPVAMRIDAAKSLLPYKHARMGEKGKKEQAKERAQDVGSRPRFSSKAPPRLHVFDGGRGRES